MELGDTVRDTITGFTGVVLSRTTHLHAATQLCVHSTHLCEGELPGEGVWLEEARCVVVDYDGARDLKHNIL